MMAAKQESNLQNLANMKAAADSVEEQQANLQQVRNFLYYIVDAL